MPDTGCGDKVAALSACGFTGATASAFSVAGDGGDVGSIAGTAVAGDAPRAASAAAPPAAGPDEPGWMPRASATAFAERITVAFSTITVMVAPLMPSILTCPGRAAPMMILSKTD